jgi:general stress protein YciG
MLSKKPTIAELNAESEMHAGLIAQARAQLADVLRAGGDTAELRAEIDRRERRRMEIVLLLARDAGEQAERDAALIGRKGGTRSHKVRAEIEAMLATLAAPRHPNHI